MVKKNASKGKKVMVKKSDKKSACADKCKCASYTLKVEKPFGKSQLVGAISGLACVSKKEAGSVLDVLFQAISAHLCKRGPGAFMLPGIARFRVIKKPATKAREGVNPFTGQPMVFAAKPARNVIKIRPLKKLKDIAK